MFDESLPNDLTRIEEDIGPLMRFEPRTDFGERILGTMREELRRDRSAARWKFALQLAACAFVWLHVSFFAASITSFHLRDDSAEMRDNPLAARQQGVFPNHLYSGE
jgi:hypothetical protein